MSGKKYDIAPCLIKQIKFFREKKVPKRNRGKVASQKLFRGSVSSSLKKDEDQRDSVCGKESQIMTPKIVCDAGNFLSLTSVIQIPSTQQQKTPDEETFHSTDVREQANFSTQSPIISVNDTDRHQDKCREQVWEVERGRQQWKCITLHITTAPLATQ